MPILKLQWRILLHGTKHFSLIEKVIRCAYNPRLGTLIWLARGQEVLPDMQGGVTDCVTNMV